VSAFWSYTVIGIVFGSVYAITATGLVVTYTTTGVFNFAQGAVGMFAAFSYWQLTVAWHWPPLVALALLLLVGAPLLGAAVEVVLMRRLYGATADRMLMVTLGLLLILVGVAVAIWGNPANPQIVPPFFAGHSVTIAGVVVTWQQLLVVLAAAAIALTLRVFFKRFRAGIAMRAVVDDPELLALAGASPHRIARHGWMLGISLAALAGILLAPAVGSTGLNVDTLTLLVINGYAAAVVGRLRNLPLTFAGGLALGLADAYAIGYLPGRLPDSIVSQIPSVMPIVFLFIALLLIPAARLVAAGRLPVHMPARVAGGRESVAGAILLVAAVAVVSPLLNGLALSSVSQGFALGIVALSLVLLTGYAGQVSLCQLTFLGVGAYTMAKVGGGGSWWGLLAAVGVSAAVGVLVALPAIRLRGLYLALATLAFGEAAYYAFFENSSIFGTGGSLPVGRLPLPGVPSGSVSDRTELMMIAVTFALCAVGVLWLRRGAFGRRLVALNDSPAAFATLGMSPAWTKVAVFALSAGMAGLGGVLYAGQQGGIGGSDVLLFSSLTLLLLVSIWGIRTASGALAGGLSLSVLPVAQAHLPHALADLTGLAAGVGIILLARSPEGIFGSGWFPTRLRLPFTTEPAPACPAEEIAEERVGAVG